jgi:RHS repeat-associated protein
MPGISGIQWDVFDRMTQATVNGSTSSYKYDAFGRRVAQETPNGTNWFFYDMGGRLLVTYPWMNGYQPVRTAYFAGQRVGQYKDRVGSVRSTNGGVSSHYYPFGEEITSTANDRYKFAETFRDADSGLDYALNRYYAAGIGRFLSPDRLGKSSANPSKPMSWSRYSYAEDDPVNGYDPAGMVTVAVGDGWFVECNFFDTGDPFCYVWAFGPGPGPAPGPGVGGTVPPVPPAPPRPECDRSKANNAQKLDWIAAHGKDAAKVAGELGVTTAEILGLSALESGWGASRFAADFNNFFSLYYPVPLATGSIPAADNPKAKLATFASYADSAESFGLAYGWIVSGLTNPSEFAAALKNAGKYGIDPKTGAKVKSFVGDTARTIEGLAMRLDCEKW